MSMKVDFARCYSLFFQIFESEECWNKFDSSLHVENDDEFHRFFSFVTHCICWLFYFPILEINFCYNLELKWSSLSSCDANGKVGLSCHIQGSRIKLQEVKFKNTWENVFVWKQTFQEYFWNKLKANLQRITKHAGFKISKMYAIENREKLSISNILGLWPNHRRTFNNTAINSRTFRGIKWNIQIQEHFRTFWGCVWRLAAAQQG